jgi:hypothetical protein
MPIACLALAWHETAIVRGGKDGTAISWNQGWIPASPNRNVAAHIELTLTAIGQYVVQSQQAVR